MTHQYRFGDLLIDPHSFRLLQAGKPVAIEPKALNVLIFLVQHQGRLVERKELLSAVWGDAFVTDHVLNRSIGQLRKVLGDDSKEPRYIETVPTLGYRFIAVVQTETPGSTPSPTPAPVEPPGRTPEDGGKSFERPSPIADTSVNEIVHIELADTTVSEAVSKPASREAEIFPAKRPAWRISKLVVCGAGLAVVLVEAASLLSRTPNSGPLESTQITFAGDPKERPIFTDGSRLYFESRGIPSQMSESGGMIIPMRILEPGMHLADVSADGSKVLAAKADLNTETGSGSLWVSSVMGGSPRKIGDDLGIIAVWTPDGHSIVSALADTLYGVDENGGHRTKLWAAPGPVTDLSFSPDATQLCVTVEREQASQLWMMRPDGTQAHLLKVTWPASQDLRNGRWSPDGRHFVFRSDGEGHQNIYEVVKPDWLHFWRKPKAVRLTGNQIEIRASAPSRDSKGLFVLGRLDQGAMQVFQPESRTMAPLLNGISAQSLRISRDRQWMAYSEYPSGNLWKSRLDGSGALQLTNSSTAWVEWSPDNKWIAYSDWHKIYRVSAEGGQPEKLIPSGDFETAMTWSPDGRSIVFNYFDFVHGPSGLFSVDLATRKVTPMPGAETYYVPSWSPDGRYLAAITANPSRMVVYSAESKTWKVLKIFDVPWGLFTWSRDSKSIYMAVQTDAKGIYRLSVPDGRWEKLVGLENVDIEDEGFVSLAASDQPAIMNHIGVSQVYFLRWPD